MATIRWYYRLVTPPDLSTWLMLDTTPSSGPGAFIGWVVGTGATLHSEVEGRVTGDRPSTTFVGTTVPDGTLDPVLTDAFRTLDPLNGTFASGNWTVQFAVVSLVSAGAADGQIVFRLIKANADGSGATEITSGQQLASVCTNVLSTPDSNSTLTFNPGAFTLTNQYLFIQTAWKRTGAGGMTTTTIRLRLGTSATVGTTILSSDFTPAGAGPITGTLTATLAAATVSATGLVTAAPITGTATLTLATLTLTTDADVEVRGTATPTLAPATLSAGATQLDARTGTLAVTLAPATLTSDVDLEVRGTLTRTLATVTLTTEGDVEVRGTATPILAPATLTTDADLEVHGTLTATLAPATLTATAGVELRGTATLTLAPATLTGTASSAAAHTGDLVAVLAPATLSASATGQAARTGTLAATLAPATCTASGIVATAGALTATLAPATVTSSGQVAIAGAATLTLGAVTTTTDADVRLAGVLAQTLAACTLVGRASEANVSDIVITAAVAFSGAVAIAAPITRYVSTPDTVAGAVTITRGITTQTTLARQVAARGPVARAVRAGPTTITRAVPVEVER